jgi:undecaprenyl-diphosphatase
MAFAAKYLFLLVLLLALVFIVTRGWPGAKSVLFFAVFSLPLTFGLARLAGHLYFDPRPFVSGHFMPLISHARDNGFPSDHALLCFSLASLVFVFDRKWGLLLGAIAVLVSAARVYAGVHSPIDIVGSFLISVVAVSIVYLARNLVRQRRILHAGSG